MTDANATSIDFLPLGGDRRAGGPSTRPLGMTPLGVRSEVDARFVRSNG